MAAALTPRLGLWVDVVTHRYRIAERFARLVTARARLHVVDLAGFMSRDHGIQRAGLDLGTVHKRRTP